MPGMRRHDSPPVRRGFNIREFKALDDAQGLFSGYLAVFGVEDQVWADPLDKGDIIEPGAFAKTLGDMTARQASRAQRGLPSGRYLLPIFWAHKSDDPIGGFTVLREDAIGLYFEAELDMNIPQGQRAYSGLKAGYIPGMSFGYFAVNYGYDRQGRRHLREVSVFEGTVTPIPMNQEAVVMEVKSASDDDKAAQAARSKKYGIAVKDGGNVTKPGQWAKLSDDQFADPVNYKLPMPDKAHADNAASRFGQDATRSQYSSKEQGIIAARIAKAQKGYGEDEDDEGDESKALDIAADGTHAPFTGTHTHAHSAFKSQGGDDMHEHEHTHDGDATHEHAHGKSVARPVARTHGGKALDFTTAYAQVSQDDSLQDEWGDTMQALVNALYSTMCIGNLPGDSDAADTADTILQQFSAAMSDLVKRSLAAVFTPCLDDDGDTFLDPDAPEYGDSDAMDDSDAGYMSLATVRAGAKAGRTMSAANAKAMQQALDMIQAAHTAAAKGMQQARAGHKQATALLKAMAAGTPAEATTEDDMEEAYTPANKGLDTAADSDTDRAPGAPHSDTTQQPQMTADDLKALITRKMAARKLAAAVVASTH